MVFTSTLPSTYKILYVEGAVGTRATTHGGWQAVRFGRKIEDAMAGNLPTAWVDTAGSSPRSGIFWKSGRRD